jgi:serpin B
MRRRGIIVGLVTVLVAGSVALMPRSDQDVADETARAVSTQLVRADVARARPAVADDVVRELVRDNRAFAFELYERLGGEEDGNLFFSPHSISTALAMTYPGARGKTAEEMAKTLHFTLAGDALHAAFNRLTLDLSDREGAPVGAAGEPLELEIANALWGQTGYPFREEFLRTLASHYDAGMNLVDFARRAEGSRLAINRWVEDHTNGKVEELLPPDVISDLTRLVLVNAIYFKGAWTSPFESAADGSFSNLDGTRATVPMMAKKWKRGYATGEGYAAVRLPYIGGASMTVIVPDEGRFADVETALDADELARIAANLTTHDVDLRMPRFRVETQFKLKEALEALGMVEAFKEPRGESGADLTGMTQRRELFLTEVVHKAFVSVDEKGTEAAAATGVIVQAVSGAPPATLHVERPFIFTIEDDTTGALLFLGRVTTL